MHGSAGTFQDMRAIMESRAQACNTVLEPETTHGPLWNWLARLNMRLLVWDIPMKGQTQKEAPPDDVMKRGRAKREPAETGRHLGHLFQHMSCSPNS